ncbi:tetratricopeptide (TPR) repeat protein [Paenibacillus sp. DS2015]|uniref:tetratricopeptide repeat protein n=1 Tax=Paenibacillus sp. DS2015 TaxID=3373917 RepID=UPI003D218392
MNEDKLRAEDLYNKIIPVHLDANFFFERAVRSLDRNHYDKALKYFGKAVEYEPENPVNHCNVAGIMSEMGDFSGSNAVLAQVLKDIDPAMTECYYYMANNFANMEQFEEAEKALVTYLEEDSEGQFLEEAEEMMDLLHYELNRPAKLHRIKSREGMVEHENARALLEEGKFAQAVDILEEIVKNYPDFLSARNNLALAYYYVGLFDRAKETIGEVLEQEPGNLHGLCNLAIFYQHEHNMTELAPLVRTLTVTIPFHQEHVFKLATTMGILGQHEVAYRHFRRLLKDEDMNSDPSLYHYTAAAAFNCERYVDAERCWKFAQKLDPESDVPKFFLSQLHQFQAGTSVQPKISYHYHLPFEEQLKLWELDGDQMTEEIRHNPLIRSSFFWALRHGDVGTKLQVIQAFAWIADDEVKQALLVFIQEPDEDIELKEAAMFVLQGMGIDRETLLLDDSEESSQDSVKDNLLPEDCNWQLVVNKTLEMMGRSSLNQQEDVQRLWTEFLNKSYPDTPQLHHMEAWSAALEYWSSKIYGDSITYEEVAKRYGLSVSTVSRYARRMDRVCHMKGRKRSLL